MLRNLFATLHEMSHLRTSIAAVAGTVLIASYSAAQDDAHVAPARRDVYTPGVMVRSLPLDVAKIAPAAYGDWDEDKR